MKEKFEKSRISIFSEAPQVPDESENNTEVFEESKFSFMSDEVEEKDEGHPKNRITGSVVKSSVARNYLSRGSVE